MIRDKVHKQLVLDVAKARGLSPALVRDVVEHSLAFIPQTMKRGLFEGVRLPGFGTFYVNLRRLQYLQVNVAETAAVVKEIRAKKKTPPDAPV